MPYTPQFIALSTLFTILIILFSIVVLLYIETHHKNGSGDMAAPVIVSQTERITIPVTGISQIDVK